MRILLSSNILTGSTGYSNQSGLIIPRLCALGHDVAQHAWYGLDGCVLTANVEHAGTTYPIRVYPKYRDGYGNDIGAAHAADWNADIILTLIDAWVLNPDALSSGKARFVPYFPIDMEPIPPPVLSVVAKSYQPIVYSRFAERMAHNAGLDVRYVPHCVDTNAYTPGPQDEARQALGWPKDAFILGMVAANKGFPSRKAFPEVLAAFAHFSRKHTDAMIYLHTNRGVTDGMGGVNLPELCAFYGVQDKVIFADEYQQIRGFPTEKMRDIYRAMDVYVSPSLGEGFGIPIVEAQACGTPVIVGDWTSMSELCFAGWKLPKPGRAVDGYGQIEQPWYTPLASQQYIPSIADILEAMEEMYLRCAPEISNDARQGAIAYDADLVARDYWQPVLAEIAERIEAESAVLV